MLAQAALTDTDRQEFGFFNALKEKNPGFENGRANWTASGGSFTTGTSTLIEGKVYGIFDSSSASQTLTSAAVTLHRTGTCEVSGFFRVPSGTSTYLLQAYDGTNVLGSETITNSTTAREHITEYPCQTSGTVSARLISVASDEPAIEIDGFKIGVARGVGATQLLTPVESYSPTFNSTTGHSASNGWYYRKGDRAVIGGSILFNGTGAATTFTVSLPSACTIDTTKINDSTAASTRNRVGAWSWYDDSGGLSINPQWVRINTTTTLLFMDGSNSVISNIFANNDRISWQADVPCVGWAAQSVVMPNAQGWFVAGEITGGNPSLGVASVTSYTEITNASLTLTPQSGSAAMGIMCSSTNAAATPSTSASTCSAGSESVGFNANFPTSGFYEVCAEFAHQAEVDSGEGLRATFQVIQTPTNAQTLSQEAGSKVTSGTSGMTIATGVQSAVNNPHTRCGFFNLSAGINGFRLMFEQIVGGSPNTSVVLADASVNEGQRAIRWSAKPVSSQQQAILANSVSTGTANGNKIGAARLDCDSSSSIVENPDGMISTIGNISTGTCVVTFATGYFSAKPICSPSWDGNSTPTTPFSYYSICTSATSCNVGGGGSVTTAQMNIICIGPR